MYSNPDPQHSVLRTRCFVKRLLYCAGAYHKRFANSSLPEQKNSIIRKLDSSCSYMQQTTFLWFMRYFLYSLNKLQREAAAGQVFYRQR